MFLELKNIHFQLPCVLETIQDNRIRTTLLVQYFQLKKKKTLNVAKSRKLLKIDIKLY